MLDEMTETIELFINDVHFLPAMAQLQRRYFDCLLTEGFTEEQALALVTQFKINQ